MKHRRTRHPRRSGNVLVLTAFMMVAMVGMLAFALDLGYLYVVKTQLQRSADSAAIAAAWELVDDEYQTGVLTPAVMNNLIWDRAIEFAGSNSVLGYAPTLASGDVEIGYLADPSNPAATINMASSNLSNTVRVFVRRASDVNGEVPLFFANFLGWDNIAVGAQATASVINNISGFQAPSSGENLGIMPFALDQETWNDMLAGVGLDDWTWDADTGTVSPGPDGVLEVNLYPQGTGSPGNRGTVDIGSNNNSTADIARQITDGVTSDDLDYHGGSLELDECGKLYLNGDTGISAGVKDELASVIGEPKVIPIFSTVTGPGNNAQFTIVQFVGVRIVEVDLTGASSSKRVMIQPANVVIRGAIPSTSSTQASYFVYSPVWLVR